MTTREKTLEERLARYRQIKLSVIGRKSRRTISSRSGTLSHFTQPCGCHIYELREKIQKCAFQFRPNTLHIIVVSGIAWIVAAKYPLKGVTSALQRSESSKEA